MKLDLKTSARPTRAEEAPDHPKGYLSRLPNALRERELPDGSKVMECVYTPHSLRATAATLLLDSDVDIVEVKELLGHRWYAGGQTHGS